MRCKFIFSTTDAGRWRIFEYVDRPKVCSKVDKSLEFPVERLQVFANHGGEVIVRSLSGSTGLLLPPVAFCKALMCAPTRESQKSAPKEKSAMHVRAYRKKKLKSQPTTLPKLSYFVI